MLVQHCTAGLVPYADRAAMYMWTVTLELDLTILSVLPSRFQLVKPHWERHLKATNKPSRDSSLPAFTVFCLCFFFFFFSLSLGLDSNWIKDDGGTATYWQQWWWCWSHSKLWQLCWYFVDRCDSCWLQNRLRQNFRNKPLFVFPKIHEFAVNKVNGDYTKGGVTCVLGKVSTSVWTARI